MSAASWPTAADIEARNYSLCYATYRYGMPGGWSPAFLVNTTSKPEARERALNYARAEWGEPDDVCVWPRNYVRDARRALKDGYYEAGQL